MTMKLLRMLNKSTILKSYTWHQTSVSSIIDFYNCMQYLIIVMSTNYTENFIITRAF
jgi:hypothetical protein